MSSFFTVPSSQKKRKRAETTTENPKKKRASLKPSKPSKSSKSAQKDQFDEDISGSDSDSEDDGPSKRDIDFDQDSGSNSEGGEEETAAERRLRLAERYLENVREEVDDIGFDAEDIDRDLIAERLQEDVAESKGLIYRQLASELSFEDATHTYFRTNDTQTVTSVATCAPYAYTVTKDMWLHKWRLQDLPSAQFPQNKKSKKPPPPPRRRPEKIRAVRGDIRKAKDTTYRGHVDQILCVAASQDGKFVVTGGKDRRLIVWDAETLRVLRVFSMHRDSVLGVAFRRGTNQLYSCSADRTVKIWSLDELAYVETLFGHQDVVVDVAALSQEVCISVGARERVSRLWNIVKETNMVYRSGGGEKKSKSNPGGKQKVQEGSMDRVAMIDEETWVTGGDSGNLTLFVKHRKKPLFNVTLAHGEDPPLSPEEASAEEHPDPRIIPAAQPRWITALATIPYSDVILSGSWDGSLRAWKLSEDKKKIEPLGIVGLKTQAEGQSISTNESNQEDSYTVRGVINDISIFERGDRGKDGVCIVVAVGKQHRLGKWQKVEGKNGALVFEIPRKLTAGKTNGVEHVATEHEEMLDD